MKLGKIDLCKIKKVTMIEILTAILILVAIGIYYSPNFMYKQEMLKAAKAKAQNAIFTAKVLEKFAQNKNAKATEVATNIIEELNKTGVNPYDKNEKLYTYNVDCKACNKIECDDSLNMIIITTMNKKGELTGRTVIQPPSFVVYSKDEDK